jgi:hypothetical protein
MISDDPAIKRGFLRMIGILGGTFAAIGYVGAYLVGSGVVGYAILPLLIMALLHLFVWAVRIRKFGRYPEDIRPFIPDELNRTLGYMILVRLGILAAIVVVLAITIGTALAGYGWETGIHAVVGLLIASVLASLLFGTALNLLLLRSRVQN